MWVLRLYSSLSELFQYSSNCAFSYTFQNQSVDLFIKGACWDFYWVCIKSLGHIREKWHLNCIKFSNPWIQIVSLIIYISFGFFHQYFAVFTCISCTYYVRFIPKHFSFWCCYKKYRLLSLKFKSLIAGIQESSCLVNWHCFWDLPKFSFGSEVVLFALFSF